jgi:diguanylate cyclase (GGDEF)-like protein/PAS domain S-box-containing protein
LRNEFDVFHFTLPMMRHGIKLSLNNSINSSAHKLIEWIVERLPAIIHRERGGAFNYLTAIALMGIALWLRMTIAPITAGLQYITFFPAVTLAAVIGGIWPGLFATIIGVSLATFIFTPPYYSFSVEVIRASFWSNMVFITDAIIVCSSIEAMHRYRARYAAELIEAKHHETKLLKDEASLRAVLDNMPYLAWLKDSDGRYIIINRMFADYLRLEDPRQAAGKTDLDLQPKELAEKYRADDAEVMVARKQKHVEESAFDGNTAQWVETYKTPIIDQHGNVLGTVGFAKDITERKKAEEEKLLESETGRRQAEDTRTRLMAHVGASPDFVGFADASDAHILYINAAGRAMIGVGEDEDITNYKVADCHPAWANRILEEVALPTATRTGFWQGECALQHRDGHEIPVLIVLVAHKSPAGVVDIFSTTIRDISERKLMEDTLRESEEKLRGLYELSPLGIALSDMIGRYVEFNESFRHICGYTEKELKALDYWALTPKKYEADEALQLNALTGTGHYGPYEKEYVRKDGSLIPLRLSGVMVTGRNGQKYIWSIVENITERKQAEIKLRQERDRNQVFLDTVQTLILALNAEGRITMINRAGCELLGYTESELLGRNWFETCLPQPEGMSVIYNVFQQIMAGNMSSSEYYENYILRSDGTTLLIAWNNNYITDDAGHNIGTISSGQDISERKRAENNLRITSSVFDNSHEAIIITDADNVILDANPAFIRFASHINKAVDGDNVEVNSAVERWTESDNVIGKRVSEIIPGLLKSCPELSSLNSLASTSGKMERVDAYMSELDMWFSVSIYSPKPEYFVTLFDNITERKQVEQALRIAAATFEIHEAILITDAKGDIIRVNSAFSDITGYREDEVVGKNPRIMSSGLQDKSFFIEMWQQLLHTGSWAGEIWDKRKNGQIYPKWLTITAVKNERQETTNYVAIFSDITARKQTEEEIRNLAFYDALTQLPNRRLFLDRFRAALTISTRRNDYGAVLFIDLDRFKILNDTLGHDFGDLLLIDVAARIKSCVREMDTVARLGGDEFVVLIESISEDQDETSHKIGLIAEKIRDALAQPYLLKFHEHHCSPSIGISLYRSNEKTVDELIQQADMAMYQAKESGRNAVRFFDPHMQERVSNRASLENDLHTAIKDGHLYLYYQVQMDGKRPIGAEGLLRWIHPVRGMVLPRSLSGLND